MKKFFALSLLIGSSIAFAASGKFLLGFTSLSDQQDVDIFNLPECRDSLNERATHVQVEVLKYDAEIDRMVVTYQNGERQRLNLRNYFLAGQRGNWINLEGQARCVKSIRITGDTKTANYAPYKQAQVLIYGLWDR